MINKKLSYNALEEYFQKQRTEERKVSHRFVQIVYNLENKLTEDI